MVGRTYIDSKSLYDTILSSHYNDESDIAYNAGAFPTLTINDWPNVKTADKAQIHAGALAEGWGILFEDPPE